MADDDAGKPHHTIAPQQASADDLAKWMSSSDVQQRRVDQLVLPGTHDSGCYDRFSLKLNCFNHSRGLRFAHLRGTRALTRPFANRWARTQNVPIYRQLRMGVRFLDLRVGLNARTENYHIVHTFTGPCVSELLEDIKRFLEECPQEVVVLYVVPKGGLDNRRLISYLVDHLGPHLHRNLHNGAMYLTVGEMVSAGERVILAYEDSNVFSDELIPADKRALLWNSSLLHDRFFDTDNLRKKCKLIAQELDEFVDSKSRGGDKVDTAHGERHSSPPNEADKQLFQLTFTLTPQGRTILAGTFFGCCRLRSLEVLAERMNEQLADFLDRLASRQKSEVRVVTVDFADEHLVRTIFQMNTSIE